MTSCASRQKARRVYGVINLKRKINRLKKNRERRNCVWFGNQIETRIGSLSVSVSLSGCVSAQTLKSLLTRCLVERVQTADTNPVSQTHTETHAHVRACSYILEHTCKWNMISMKGVYHVMPGLIYCLLWCQRFFCTSELLKLKKKC